MIYAQSYSIPELEVLANITIIRNQVRLENPKKDEAMSMLNRNYVNKWSKKVLFHVMTIKFKMCNVNNKSRIYLGTKYIEPNQLRYQNRSMEGDNYISMCKRRCLFILKFPNLKHWL